ncbi:MAG: hydrolase 1, exosortase A system-associated [Burkholderiaceae bacterium]|jgi:exosortase A-associated hydrolase 1|nr:hydrolase 1, exosortase A system-associated [Burkholderiaceae bacterium]MCZ8174277.1 hydrolase 1, exosortase A system-associated [Burkholderiaceae bacterium]
MSDARFHESALSFVCEDETLHGVLTRPAHQPASAGVLVIVGGPQYRVGSHRQFVQLARALAAGGVACLRFDVRGMGDSTGELHDFETIDPDITAALAALRAAVPTLQSTVLWGLCDGASAALMHLERHEATGISGLVLVNPWVRTVASQARTRVKHYYLQRLADPAFWRKLLRGGVGLRAVSGLFGNLRVARGAPRPDSQAHYTERMARGWLAFDGPRLLALSDNDYTAREFEEFTGCDARWQQALQHRTPQRLVLEGADHTCSQPAASRRLEVATLAFIASINCGS